MPRKTSPPVSGNVLRSLPGVTVCMDMDSKQNLQLRILSITADPFAHHILTRKQIPASSDSSAVRRISEISDTPPPFLPDNASMTHRLAVEEALRKGCTPVSNIRPGICHFCQTRKTTQWRKGPAGIRTLCNGCGLAWAKKVKNVAAKSKIPIAKAEAQLIQSIPKLN